VEAIKFCCFLQVKSRKRVLAWPFLTRLLSVLAIIYSLRPIPPHTRFQLYILLLGTPYKVRNIIYGSQPISYSTTWLLLDSLSWPSIFTIPLANGQLSSSAGLLSKRLVPRHVSPPIPFCSVPQPHDRQQSPKTHTALAPRVNRCVLFQRARYAIDFPNKWS
jgi:hypothetical protein